MYREYAELYDRSRQNRFSQRMARYCRAVWASFGFTPKSLLDLACGTGTAALAFSRAGLDVTGLDLSPAMLARARKKPGGKAIRWEQGDLRDFELGRAFDSATCFYDSLNYLLDPEDLTKAFRQISLHLTPGAPFLFDLASEYALAREWGDSLEVYPGDDVYQVWRSRYSPTDRIATLELTLFAREAQGYRKVEEVHRHRAFSPQEVETALSSAGLKLEGTFDCLSLEPPAPDCSRLAYLAKRVAIQLS